ncbi:helix-turn-helix transcriptional regulator [Paenibacillus sp. IITD108]|uniref:helix-turn-helix transcriptional regulator n=1 Tax=Paenibacillus sp. IITD108 TaxID=3116649 RepID=UPI002F3F97E2
MTADLHTLEGKSFWDERFPMFITREREAFTLPLHIHDFIEIQYVAEGKGFHYIGDERVVAEKGDLYIIPIGTHHVYRPSSPLSKNELIVYNCLFDKNVPQQLGLSYPLPAEIYSLLNGESASYRRYRDTSSEGRQLLEGMHQEYFSKQAGYEAALYAQLTKLLVYLYRLETNQAFSMPAYSGISIILSYIDKHYNQTITLANAAQLISTSPSYVQKIFKQVTGQSFIEYIQNVRVKKSLELLQHPFYSIKEIANLVGYRDLKFFYTLFKKKTGHSPAQYRSRLTTPNIENQ